MVSFHAPITGLPGTLVYTLRARAEEHGRSDAILSDPQAVHWYSQLSIPDATQQAMEMAYSPIFQLGTAVRARLYDDICCQFLDAHSPACVLELGAGLSTRYQRLHRPGMQWFELDLPPAIAARKLVDKETADHHFLAASMLDAGWTERVMETAVPPHQTLFMAEGVLFFLNPEEIHQLFHLLRTHFPGATLACDILTQEYSPKARARFAAAHTPIQWLVANEEELATWGLHIRKSQTVTHHYLERWEALGFKRQRLLATQGNIILTTMLTPL
ncbi:MAG: class I SAM-dependent methyltransferase [Ardenticatenaceae bacterium]|nr:class I SAM-dependent methyltransferase [Anaerolineales bacterium]MCB8922445.1 class I SAM-dependent methyltransferase [Ardenticatenaceae bacterium]MCB8989913.1 class I SAM-dependent methyltransferase [Ardenticatenaceae bacterium]